MPVSSRISLNRASSNDSSHSTLPPGNQSALFLLTTLWSNISSPYTMMAFTETMDLTMLDSIKIRNDTELYPLGPEVRALVSELVRRDLDRRERVRHFRSTLAENKLNYVNLDKRRVVALKAYQVFIIPRSYWTASLRHAYLRTEI